MSDPSVPQYLLDLAQQTPIPAPLSDTGLRHRFPDLADPGVSVGQVWRARWEDRSVLVLIVARDDPSMVTMVPLTIEPPAEDEHCVIVEPGLTVFGVDVTVWCGLTCQLPVRVLEQPVDVWDGSLVGYLATRRDSRSAPIPSGMRRGVAIESLFASAALVMAELQDDLAALQQSPSLPVAEKGLSPRSLQSQLGKDVDFQALVAGLVEFDLSQADVMKVLSGKAPLTPDVASAVADLTGLPEVQIAMSVHPLPAEFVAEVEQPAWRRHWQRRAAQDGTDEATARLNESYDMFARAARQTGGGEADWHGRLQQYLRRSTEQEHGDR